MAEEAESCLDSDYEKCLR